MPTGYPAILLLEGRVAVVVGGGPEAARKARTLIDAGARVRAVVPPPAAPDPSLPAEVEVLARPYEAAVLEGASVVVDASGDPAVAEAVAKDARAAGIPVNVVDDPEHSTFIAPSILRRGDLLIAISTGGASPALAVRIRERLEREFGPEYGDYLDLVKRLKDEGDLPSEASARAAAWYRVADSDVLELVRAGKMDAALARARELLSSP
ncbi:MAG TPA: bifunctional precorrin-2 dehydrogenase/sirohydrochlorin ferrochelatase [Actinomycetota bacterium]